MFKSINIEFQLNVFFVNFDENTKKWIQIRIIYKAD